MVLGRCRCNLTLANFKFISRIDIIGRTVPLLKPPQSPHCYLGAVDHVKFFSPIPGHAASLVLSCHSDPIVLKPFDLAQVCQGNKICSKLVLTWKLTLVLSFPANCISNWKLNGISRTNISKVTLNTTNKLPMLQSGPVVHDGPPAGLGGGVKLCSGAWKHGPERPVGPQELTDN